MVSEYVVSEALIQEEEKVHWLVYYISKWLINAETRYLEMEKLALALLITSRKLRLHFHSHIIYILTNYPLRQVLQKSDASGHLLKCVIELSQFDIKFIPRPAINRQVIANFITEFTTLEDKRSEEALVVPMTRIPKWRLYMDGSSNEGES